ncbi:hypothetical protein ALON55S_05782 [Alishewanella longhuensis]
MANNLPAVYSLPNAKLLEHNTPLYGLWRIVRSAVLTAPAHASYYCAAQRGLAIMPETGSHLGLRCRVPALRTNGICYMSAAQVRLIPTCRHSYCDNSNVIMRFDLLPAASLCPAVCECCAHERCLRQLSILGCLSCSLFMQGLRQQWRT